MVLDGGPDPPRRGGVGVGENLPIVDPLRISKLADEARDFKFGMLILLRLGP